MADGRVGALSGSALCGGLCHRDPRASYSACIEWDSNVCRGQQVRVQDR